MSVQHNYILVSDFQAKICKCFRTGVPLLEPGDWWTLTQTTFSWVDFGGAFLPNLAGHSLFLRVYIYTYIHTYIYIHIYIFTHIYIYIYIFIYIYTHIYIHIYTYIYTHVLGGAFLPDLFWKLLIHIYLYIYRLVG